MNWRRAAAVCAVACAEAARGRHPCREARHLAGAVAGAVARTRGPARGRQALGCQPGTRPGRGSPLRPGPRLARVRNRAVLPAGHRPRTGRVLARGVLSGIRPRAGVGIPVGIRVLGYCRASGPGRGRSRNARHGPFGTGARGFRRGGGGGRTGRNAASLPRLQAPRVSASTGAVLARAVLPPGLDLTDLAADPREVNLYASAARLRPGGAVVLEFCLGVVPHRDAGPERSAERPVAVNDQRRPGWQCRGFAGNRERTVYSWAMGSVAAYGGGALWVATSGGLVACVNPLTGTVRSRGVMTSRPGLVVAALPRIPRRGRWRLCSAAAAMPAWSPSARRAPAGARVQDECEDLGLVPQLIVTSGWADVSARAQLRAEQQPITRRGGGAQARHPLRRLVDQHARVMQAPGDQQARPAPSGTLS